MKKALLILFLSSFCIGIFSQNYYYYYDGKKQYLDVDTTSIYISASNSEGINTYVRTKLRTRSLPNIQKVSFSSLKSIPRKKTKDSYWTTQKISKSISYQQVIKDLKQSKEVETVSPFFRLGDNESFAMSHLFYVKLKNETDIKLLEAFCVENKVDIIGNNISMPLWFTLACTKETNGDALAMSNKFYESRKFSRAEPDFMSYKQQSETTEPYFTFQWGLKNNNGLNIEAAWDYSKGKGVVVAVIDAGIELTHPDLNIHPISYNAVTGTSPSSIYSSHGTAVAGIIGAKENGVGVIGIAPQSNLMSISVNFGGANSISHLANSFNFAWQNGADVINNSWGGGTPSDLITEAINNALSKGRNGLGCIITFSTGNNDSSVNYPANLSQIIGVGASSNDGRRKSKKSPDTEQWGGCYGEGLDITAPGVLIPTTDRTGAAGYNPYTNIHKGAGGSLSITEFTDISYTKYFNGTSSACPHVSGVAALILSINPKLTHTQVRDIIESTARKHGGYSYSTNKRNGTWNNEMGYGLIDAGAAVSRANNMLYSISGPDEIWQGKNCGNYGCMYSINSSTEAESFDVSTVEWKFVEGNASDNIKIIPFRSPYSGKPTEHITLQVASHEGGTRLNGAFTLEAYIPELNKRARKTIIVYPKYIDGYFDDRNGIKKTFFDLQSGYPMEENLIYPLLTKQINQTIDYYITNPDPNRQGNKGAFTITPIDIHNGAFWFNSHNMGSVRLNRSDKTISFVINYKGEMGTLSKTITLKAAYPNVLKVLPKQNNIAVSIDSEDSNIRNNISARTLNNTSINQNYRYEIVPILSVAKIFKGKFSLNSDQTYYIDTSVIPNGIYVLAIYNSNNELVKSLKFNVNR